MSEGRFAAIDVETTGLSPLTGGRVIEIGAVVIEGNNLIDEFHSLINIETPVPQKISKINGITTDMIQGKSKMIEIIPMFLEFIKGSTLIAHNASFDIGFLKSELSRHGMMLSNNYLCTLDMSRKLFPGLTNHRLETVSRHLLGDLPHDIQFHRAIDDARLVGRIWIEMNQPSRKY